METKNDKQILEEILHIEQQCNSIIDAIVEVAEKYQIDIETLAKRIKSVKDIKERIRSEGESLKLLVK